MSTNTKNLSIPLPIAEYDDIVREAAEPPFLGNVADYGRKIVRGRHDMVIEVAPEAEKLHTAYKIRIDALEKENERLLSKLVSTNRDNGLSGLTLKKDQQDQHINDTLAQHKKEWEHERQAEKLAQLEVQHKLLTERNKELDKEVEELREGADLKQTIGEYLEIGGKAAGAFVAANPALQQRIGENGLAGLLFGAGGAGTGAIGASLTTDQQQDLAIGTAIRQDFEGEMYGAIVELLRFFKANPGIPISIMRSPNFQAFSTQP